MSPRQPAPEPGGLEADTRPLRQGDDWAPQLILKRFGPSIAEQDHLPRLLTACAVLLGPVRIHELVRKLELGFAQMRPALRSIPHNPVLEARHELVQRLLDRIPIAEAELKRVKGAATNDLNLRDGGLRGTELAWLTLGLRTYVLGLELSRRKSPAGLEEGIHFATTAPHLPYAEEWASRLFGTIDFDGFQLFWPEEYGRVIVVYDDGRLAYDPTPEEEDDED